MIHRTDASVPKKDLTPSTTARVDGSDATSEKSGLTPIRLLISLLAFSLVFGAIISFKLQQEWALAIHDAEGSQARTAAFMSERAATQLVRIETGLDVVGKAITQIGQASLDDEIREELGHLTALNGYIASAFLGPDGEVISFDRDDIAWRTIAETVLAEQETGVTAIMGDEPLIAHAIGVPMEGGLVGALLLLSEPQNLLPPLQAGQIGVLATQGGRALALHPETPVTSAPSAPERFGLDTQAVIALNETGGALSGAQFGDDSLILGTAPIAGSDLMLYALGPRAIDMANWHRTVVFYVLMFLGPLFAALALCSLLLRKMSNLRTIQQQLQGSEERFRLAIEGARCGVWDWDLENDNVFLTESFSRMLGRSDSIMITGTDFLSLFDEGDQHKLRAAVRSSDHEDDVNIEVRAAKLALWLQIRGRPSSLDPAEGSRRIVGVAIDITERKGAQARVAAAESRLRAALESMSESFVLWDSRRRLILWNRKFREFFGLIDAKLRPGMPYSIVEEAAGRAIEQVFDKVEGEDFFEMKLTDGRWLNYSERVTADGGLVSVGADISALKRQETTLKQNDRRLRQTVDSLKVSQERIQELARNYEQEKIRAEEANRSKSEFLANMSHELRTPLNAINGFSEMMMKEIFGSLGHERYQEYAGDIFSSGQHLLSLINDILDMSKIEAGKMELSTEPIIPSEIIEQCLRLTSARAGEKNIEVSVEGDTLPEIEADPRAVKQVLLNLLSNAMKFTPEDGKVTVRGFDTGDGIVLQVTDTGIGIPKDDLPRLGRPFEQIESHHSKKHEGSGLGLALSKSLIQMHGGTLRIDSELGVGTTVSFTLPYKPRLMSGMSEEEESLPVPDKTTDKLAGGQPETDSETSQSGDDGDNPLSTDDKDNPLSIDTTESAQSDSQSSQPEPSENEDNGDESEDYLGEWDEARPGSSSNPGPGSLKRGL